MRCYVCCAKELRYSAPPVRDWIKRLLSGKIPTDAGADMILNGKLLICDGCRVYNG